MVLESKSSQEKFENDKILLRFYYLDRKRSRILIILSNEKMWHDPFWVLIWLMMPALVQRPKAR